MTQEKKEKPKKEAPSDETPWKPDKSQVYTFEETLSKLEREKKKK